MEEPDEANVEGLKAALEKSIMKSGLMINRKEQKVTFTHSNFKDCVCYLLFFHQMIALQKLREMLFISFKKLFLFSRYSIFSPFFPTISRFKRTNESGIIYDAINYLA